MHIWVILYYVILVPSQSFLKLPFVLLLFTYSLLDSPYIYIIEKNDLHSHNALLLLEFYIKYHSNRKQIITTLISSTSILLICLHSDNTSDWTVQLMMKWYEWIQVNTRYFVSIPSSFGADALEMSTKWLYRIKQYLVIYLYLHNNKIPSLTSKNPSCHRNKQWTCKSFFY